MENMSVNCFCVVYLLYDTELVRKKEGGREGRMEGGREGGRKTER